MDIKVKNAIISVSDKTGLVEFAGTLHGMGVNIYSTGGTAKALENVGIPVTKISDYTGFPEILDGRVKSLHPMIHGGILAKRDNENHLVQMQDNLIVPFDLVVINLYPFEKVIKKSDVRADEAIENIDIGGPSMLRSSAKNYRFVCVVPEPKLYSTVIDELKIKGAITLATRKKLAMMVFEKTAYYDSLISGFFHTAVVEQGGVRYPDSISLYFNKKQELRYGENPHQSAAFYTNPDISLTGVATATKLHGKELSFNNILDIESAFETVKEFDEPTCAVIKHTNPCGAATANTVLQAFRDAWDGDPVSAFGGIVGFNRNLDWETANAVSEAGFIECIIAPGYEKAALEILKGKKNIRILETGKISKNEIYDYDMKRIVGGVLVQERDRKDITDQDLKVVTVKSVSEPELESLLFSWKIAKCVKSNAIVLARGTKTVGIGAGQMSRVDAVFMAISKANEKSKGSVLASDAFFPKPDAVQLAAENGVTAIIQPGGSVMDQEVIRACNEAGIAMVITGLRHFRH
jgi:phosphoribosylaminoimidazolecarboxamide formyltransferase/IMP cyclohydrolase